MFSPGYVIEFGRARCARSRSLSSTATAMNSFGNLARAKIVAIDEAASGHAQRVPSATEMAGPEPRDGTETGGDGRGRGFHFKVVEAGQGEGGEVRGGRGCGWGDFWCLLATVVRFVIVVVVLISDGKGVDDDINTGSLHDG